MSINNGMVCHELSWDNHSWLAISCHRSVLAPPFLSYLHLCFAYGAVNLMSINKHYSHIVLWKALLVLSSFEPFFCCPYFWASPISCLFGFCLYLSVSEYCYYVLNLYDCCDHNCKRWSNNLASNYIQLPLVCMCQMCTGSVLGILYTDVCTPYWSIIFPVKLKIKFQN